MTHTQQPLLVMVTCPTRAHAKRIASTLVKERLAACVNIVPGVESLFWWEGKLDRAKEVLLLIKTTGRRFEALRRTVCRLHPYDVPEVIGMRIAAGHQAYLRWVRTSVR